MSYLGVLSRNQELLLELLLPVSHSTPEDKATRPLAVVERLEVNGLSQMQGVTLEETNNENIFRYRYTPPPDWTSGEYRIRYYTDETKQEEVTYDTFSYQGDVAVKAANVSVKQLPEAPYGEDPFLDADFQTGTMRTIDANKITVDLSEEPTPNHLYTLILTDDVRSISGSTLPKTYAFEVTTRYTPLYATPLEMKSILKDVFPRFSIQDLYIALRDAGQKAHQMLGEIADPSNSRFEMLEERDDAYFPATKYVLYEASLKLLGQLTYDLLDFDVSEDGGGITTSSGKASFSLGDLNVSEEGPSSSSSSTADGTPPEMAMLKRLKQEIEGEIVFWKDAMMGRNARGYATPVTANSRGGGDTPESRDL